MLTKDHRELQVIQEINREMEKYINDIRYLARRDGFQISSDQICNSI